MTVRPIPAGKRGLDILLAGSGLIGSSPLWLLLAAVIKLEDGGRSSTRRSASARADVCSERTSSDR